MPGLAIDPVQYLQQIPPTQPLTAASSFTQFKQVFVGSPREASRKDKYEEIQFDDYRDPCKYERLQRITALAKEQKSYQGHDEDSGCYG